MDGPVQVLRSRATRYRRELEAAMVRDGERHIRREAFLSAPDFALNLFPDTTFEIVLDRVERTADAKGWTVSGRTSSPGDGRVILTFYGGALSGSVRLSGGEFYEVHVPASGDGEVRQCVFRGYAAGVSDAVPVALDEVRGPEKNISPAGAAVPDLRTDLRANQNGGAAQLDILVVYTARAAAARGGTSGLLAYISQVFAESNQSLSNSEAPVTFRLVHAAQVNYDDEAMAPDSASYEVALNALRSATDGQMDEAHMLRNQYGADLVSLWLSPPKPGLGGFVVGKAYLMTQGANVSGYENFAFSTVDVEYAGGVSMTFPHEIGHNLGCAHDTNNTQVSGYYNDSYGYQQSLLSPKFHTIMAYAAGCPGCTRIDHFSNPNVNYHGIPTGISAQVNNVRALTYTAPLAATWRAATGPGCSYAVSPTTVSMSPSGGNAVLTVSAGAGCSWSAQSTANWVSITAGASGAGDGSVTLAVAPNSHSAPRSTTLTIAGLGVTVNQSSTVTLPVFSVTPAAVSWTVEAGSDEPIATELSFSTGSSSVNIQLTSVLPAWLRLSETTFRSPAKITAWADPAAIAPGNYTTTLRFSSSGTQNQVVEIPVTLSVRTGRYLLASAGASFRVDLGTVFAVQRFRVKAPSGLSAPPRLRAVGGGWVSASVSAAADLFELQVQVASGGLSAGVYDGRIELSCPTGACEIATLPVRLEVVQPAVASPSPTLPPRVASGGVVNGASFAQGITPGAWISLFGAGLANTTRLWNSQDFLGNLFPLELDGVRVRVDGLPAPVQFISPGQVNFQAPSVLRTGWLMVDIVTPAGSDRVYVYSAPALPGFFQFHADGQLAALHPDGVPVTARGGAGAVMGRPATAGTVVAIYGTGFGPTSPPVESGQIFSGAAPLENAAALRVTVGGVPAAVEFAGLSAAGLNQLNVKIPALAPGLKDVFASIAGVPAQFVGRIAVE
jgi:uncharacterized protein (TIGR03437 family)